MIIVVSDRPAVLADLMPLLPIGEDFGTILISHDLGDVTWSQLGEASAIVVDTSCVAALEALSAPVLAVIVSRVVLVAPDALSPPWPASGDVRPAYVAWLGIPAARRWLAAWLRSQVTGEPIDYPPPVGTGAAPSIVHTVS